MENKISMKKYLIIKILNKSIIITVVQTTVTKSIIIKDSKEIFLRASVENISRYDIKKIFVEYGLEDFFKNNKDINDCVASICSNIAHEEIISFPSAAEINSKRSFFTKISYSIEEKSGLNLEKSYCFYISDLENFKTYCSSLPEKIKKKIDIILNEIKKNLGLRYKFSDIAIENQTIAILRLLKYGGYIPRLGKILYISFEAEHAVITVSTNNCPLFFQKIKITESNESENKTEYIMRQFVLALAFIKNDKLFGDLNDIILLIANNDNEMALKLREKLGEAYNIRIFSLDNLINDIKENEFYVSVGSALKFINNDLKNNFYIDGKKILKPLNLKKNILFFLIALLIIQIIFYFTLKIYRHRNYYQKIENDNRMILFHLVKNHSFAKWENIDWLKINVFENKVNNKFSLESAINNQFDINYYLEKIINSISSVNGSKIISINYYNVHFNDIISEYDKPYIILNGFSKEPYNILKFLGNIDGLNKLKFDSPLRKENDSVFYKFSIRADLNEKKY